MTRAKLSAVILCTLIGISIFSGVSVDRSCGKLISSSERIWELYSAGDREAAYRCAQEMESEWDDFRSMAAVLLDNGKLSEIDRVCARIVYLVESGSEELHPELTELRHMAEALRSGERPSLSSVL